MESIRQLLETYDGRLIDCCYETRMWMKELDLQGQAGAFREFAELLGTIHSDKSYAVPVYITEQELAKLKDDYGKYVDELMLATIKKGYANGLSEDEFYMLLWDSIIRSTILVSETDQAFALYYMVIDRRLPYFNVIHGLTMENDTFKKYMKQNDHAIRRIRFILYNEFSQKTEEASLLISELTSLESKEDQVVVMAAMLDTLRDDIKRLKKRIQQLSNDVD